jgi:hypothetical protein
MLLTALALAAGMAPCRTYDTALARPLAGWTHSGRALDTGHAVTLHAGRDHRLGTTLHIRRAGTFGIAIDRDGWIDLAPARAKPLAMARESRGPRCSTIRKIVCYKLRPGDYRVTVSRLRANRAKLMLVHDRVPKESR